MKTFYVFWKSVKEQVRDYRLLLFSLSLPVIFMIIFGMAFGTSFYTYRVYILNKDKGITKPKIVKTNHGQELVSLLNMITYEDGTKIFRITTVDSTEGVEEKLQKRQVVAFVTIPAEFSQVLHENRNPLIPSNTVKQPHQPPLKIRIEGDPSFPSFGIVKMLFDSIINEFISAKSGYSPPAKTVTSLIGSEGIGSEFDYVAPGIMLFAIFMLIIQSAVVLGREVEAMTIKRLQITKMKTWELLAGITGSQLLFSAVMIPLMFGTAVMVGFHSRGSLVDGFIIGLLSCFSAVALGLITAALSKNSKEAFLIGNIVIIPVIFLSGAMFPLPEIGLFNIGTRTFTLFELQPTTHSVNAFLRIFLYGAGLSDLTYEIAMLLLFSLVYFVIGVILYHRAHLKTS